jgi:hypothetical protein
VPLADIKPVYASAGFKSYKLAEAKDGNRTAPLRHRRHALT